MEQAETRGRIRIRAARAEEAEALLEIYAPYVRETAVTFEYDVPTVEEFAGRMEGVLKKYPYLAAELDGELAGYAYAAPFHVRAAFGWAVETTVYVRRGMHRAGVGSSLYRALEEALRAQGVLNLYAAIADPPEEDEYLTRDSEAFHRRQGYETIGRLHQCGYKFGRWYHMIWMEKHLGPHLDRQPPVRAFCPPPERRHRGE